MLISLCIDITANHSRGNKAHLHQGEAAQLGKPSQHMGLQIIGSEGREGQGKVSSTRAACPCHALVGDQTHFDKLSSRKDSHPESLNSVLFETYLRTLG